MNMTNNMNNFARFSNDEINIVAKAFSIIYAYSGEFDGGNNEEKFIKLTDAFDKLISEFRKSEISNFPNSEINLSNSLLSLANFSSSFPLNCCAYV